VDDLDLALYAWIYVSLPLDLDIIATAMAFAIVFSHVGLSSFPWVWIFTCWRAEIPLNPPLSAPYGE